MRPLLLTTCCGLLGGALNAQTITSVQDGAYSDPATWDCSCVPVVPATVIIQHHVTVSGPLFFGSSLQVAPGAHLEQLAPGSIQCFEPCGMIVAGTLSAANYMGTLCPVTVSGTWLAGGGLYAGLGLQLSGGTLIVNGNFSNGAGTTISGSGQICIADSSNIQGDVTGTIDICDLTPTTTVPPFVDGGAGFIGPTITFCQGTACSTGLGEPLENAPLSVSPNPAMHMATVRGVHGRVNGLALVDGAGRIVQAPWWPAADGAAVLELDGVAQGLYVVRVTDDAGTRTVRMRKD